MTRLYFIALLCAALLAGALIHPVATLVVACVGLLVPMAPLSAFPRLAGAAMLALGAVLLILFPAHAFADASTQVNEGGVWTLIRPYIDTALGLIVTGIIGFGFALLQKYTGIAIDKKYKDDLHSAAVTGINLTLSKIGDSLEGKSIDVKSQLIKGAIDWMEQSVPQALAHFDLSPDKLETFVEGKLASVPALAPYFTPTAPPAA